MNMNMSKESETGHRACLVTNGGFSSSSTHCCCTIFSMIYQQMKYVNQCVEASNESSIYLMEKVKVESANNLEASYDKFIMVENNVKCPTLSEIAKIFL